MDILLTQKDLGAVISPKTVHGMLWLQTHFDDSSWEALASEQVILPTEDIKELALDANEAGISINFVPSISIASKS